jgi:hypothetical protein
MRKSRDSAFHSDSFRAGASALVLRQAQHEGLILSSSKEEARFGNP